MNEPKNPTNDSDLSCGLAPLETGSWDPSNEECVAHDLEFDAVKAGIDNSGVTETTLNFDAGEAKVFAKSAYGLVTAPLYAVLATVIGVPLFLWHRVTRRAQQEPQPPEPPQQS